MRKNLIIALFTTALISCCGSIDPLDNLDPAITWVEPITDLECENAHFISPTGQWLVPMWDAETREIDFFHEYDYWVPNAVT